MNTLKILKWKYFLDYPGVSKDIHVFKDRYRGRFEAHRREDDSITSDSEVRLVRCPRGGECKYCYYT